MAKKGKQSGETKKSKENREKAKIINIVSEKICIKQNEVRTKDMQKRKETRNNTGDAQNRNQY
jgi:hypothetical protein